LLDTSYDSLHKHGYRAIANNIEPGADVKRYSKSMVPGIIRETLAAAAIIESGLIERAHKTGKLYLWDPFCGSGTFLIEALQMFRGDPLKREHMQFCFEHWPIFKEEEFKQVMEEIFKNLLNYELDPAVDIRVIGSDIKMFRDYVDQAELYKYRHHPNFSRNCNFKDNPLILSYHFPELNRKHHEQISDFVEAEGAEIATARVNSLVTQDPPFFSFYKGDFETIAHHILECYGSFKDFNIITNVPYGKQVLHPKRAKNLNKKVEKGIVPAEDVKYQYSAIQNTFRRFGKLCEAIGPQMDNNIYVIARKMRHSNPMSFEKLSNVSWDHQLDFTNGGLNVDMLKFNSKKINRAKEIIKIYTQ
jgi:23S rRNA G2445 N2-methylase RlmL